MKIFLETYFPKKIISCWVLAALVFVGGWIVQNCQNHIKIEVGENTSSEVFGVAAQSLLILVPFIGVMVTFGFGTIRNHIIKPNANRDNLKKGWEKGRNLFLSFSVYVFLVVLLNLLFIVFHKMIGFSLGILLGDIALIFGAMYLVVGIASRIYDVDLNLITDPTEAPK